jgi:hypothetical protein
MEKIAEPEKPTNRDLFERQMQTLETFLRTGAITREHYDKSAEGLRQKMKP